MARTPAPAVVRHLPEIGITTISRWLFNCYVIHDGGAGRPVVVDLGMPSQLAEVAAALRARGSDVAELGAALATHGHIDHVGGLPALRDQANVPVHLPHGMDQMRTGAAPIRPPGLGKVAQILPVIASQPRDLSTLRELGETGKVIGWDAKGVRLPFEPEGWLRDGDPLDALPGWEVLTTPGHSVDSTCLYHPATRTLLSGDSVLSVEGRAWFTPEYVDGRAAVATEHRLRQLDVEHLLPGHGLVVSGPRVMDDALSFADRPADGSRLKALGRVLAGRTPA